MNFRRPFQFTSTNPATRHSELMKRFGVPFDDNMVAETPNTNVMDDGFMPSSPRLQHRLSPLFSEEDHCVDNVDSMRPQPRVRVIPIEIEKGPGQHRQHTHSGDSLRNARHNIDLDSRSRSNSGSSMNRSRDHVFHSSHQQGPSTSPGTKPRVHNIPVVVEGANNKQKKQPDVINIPVQREGTKDGVQKANGPCISKSSTVKIEREPTEQPHQQASEIDKSLKQVAAVLSEFASYKRAVQTFSGVQGDKQYRYLDEMLTRCMLKLDDVETYGNEEVRKTRKAAVTQIQNAINLLDSKIQPMVESVQENNEQPSEVDTVSTAKDKVVAEQNDTSSNMSVQSCEIPEPEMKEVDAESESMIPTECNAEDVVQTGATIDDVGKCDSMELEADDKETVECKDSINDRDNTMEVEVTKGTVAVTESVSEQLMSESSQDMGQESIADIVPTDVPVCEENPAQTIVVTESEKPMCDVSKPQVTDVSAS